LADDHAQAIELVIYERLTWVKTASTDDPKAITFATRLLLAVVSTLAKMAAHWPDLLPRVRLTLVKVLKHREYVPNSVIQWTTERLQLLRYPRYAESVFLTMFLICL